MIKEKIINHLFCVSVVKTPFEDHILENLCGMLSLPWIYSHSDDDSLKSTTFATNLLTLSQRLSDSFCKWSQNSMCVVYFVLTYFYVGLLTLNISIFFNNSKRRYISNNKKGVRQVKS